MAQQQPRSIAQIYKEFTDTFSATENPRDVVRFAKRRLSVDLKYGDVQKFLTDKKKWDEQICEPLDGDLGQEWFIETLQYTSYYQKWLIDCYFKQKHHTTCSLVSLGIALNAKLLSNYYLSKYDHEDDENNDADNKLEFDSDNEEDLDTLKSRLPFLTESKLIHIFPQYSSRLTIDKVLVSGMDLDQLGQVVLDFGFSSVDVVHCTHHTKETVSAFRELCKSTLATHHMDIDGVIICNFDLWDLDLGIEGTLYGHMSPIAAYHEDSDRVLLLDTFVDESWVKLDSLYKAMCTANGKTGTFRGYVVAKGAPVWAHRQRQNQVMTQYDKVVANEDGVVVEGGSDEQANDDDRRKKTRHRKNNSSIDFDFVMNDASQNYQYNDKKQAQKITKRGVKARRSSRRLSKKLRLYLEFDSESGQQLWKETQTTPYHQKYSVVEYFQSTKATTYGLVSMAICFNAKAMASHYGNDESHKKKNDHVAHSDDEEEEFMKLDEDRIIELYQEYYLENAQNKHLNLPKIGKVLSVGMSLGEMANILRVFGCQMVDPSHTYQLNVEKFRDLVKNTLKDGSQSNDTVMFVNYDLFKLGTGIANGHISAIAGYNPKDDMVLLMDTMWMIGMCWVPLPLLYEAMNTIDDEADGKYRGCIIVEGLPLFKYE